MNKLIKIFSAAMPVALLLLVMLPLTVAATLLPPCAFYGGVKDVNGVAVGEGVRIAALIGGVEYAHTFTTADSRYSMDVPSDDPTIPGKQGGEEGDTVRFKIAEVGATQSATFMIGGAYPNFNLTAGILPLMEGDVTDVNQCVSIADAMFIAQYKAGLRVLNAEQLLCADTNDDGQVSMADAMHIAQWLVDPDGSLGVLTKPLWESPADVDMAHPVPCA